MLNCNATAQFFGRVVENAEAIAHEKWPIAVQHKRHSKLMEAFSVQAVGKMCLPSISRTNIGRSPQPDLAGSDRAGLLYLP